MAEFGGGDARMRADFVEDAGFGEGELAVQVMFAQEAEAGGVEAVELAESGDVAGLDRYGVEHGSKLVEVVAFSN